MDPPDLLAKLRFVVPSFKSRFYIISKNNFHNTNYYGYAAPLDRAFRILNMIVYDISNIDVFHDFVIYIISKLELVIYILLVLIYI